MEHQLENWLDKAEKAVQWVIDTTEKTDGVCEDCGADTSLYYAGTGFVCGACFVTDCEYWEKRGGHSSEIIFDGDPFPTEWTYDGAEHRAIVGHYFAVMAERIAVTHLRAV